MKTNEKKTAASLYSVNTVFGAEWLARDIEKDNERQHARDVDSLYPDAGDVPGPRGESVPANYDPKRHTDRLTPEQVEMLQSGGWMLTRGTTHRGVVHPDEYIDHEAVVAAIEDGLGFTFDEVRSVYLRGKGGQIPKHLRQLRDDIDVRMLALFRTGANMDLLRRLLGLPRHSLMSAVNRAQAREESE